jgi:hypothetical protein
VPASVGARPHGEATAGLGGGAHGASAGRGSGARGTAVGPWAPHPPATASSGVGSSGWGSMDGGSSSGPVNKAPWPADRAAAPSAWRRWSGAEAAPAVLRSDHGHRTPPPGDGLLRRGIRRIRLRRRRIELRRPGHGGDSWARSGQVGANPPELVSGLGSAGHGDAGGDGWCLGARRVVLGGGNGTCSIRRQVGPAGAVGVRRRCQRRGGQRRGGAGRSGGSRR